MFLSILSIPFPTSFESFLWFIEMGSTNDDDACPNLWPNATVNVFLSLVQDNFSRQIFQVNFPAKLLRQFSRKNFQDKFFWQLFQDIWLLLVYVRTARTAASFGGGESCCEVNHFHNMISPNKVLRYPPCRRTGTSIYCTGISICALYHLCQYLLYRYPLPLALHDAAAIAGTGWYAWQRRRR